MILKKYFWSILVRIFILDFLQSYFEILFFEFCITNCCYKFKGISGGSAHSGESAEKSISHWTFQMSFKFKFSVTTETVTTIFFIWKKHLWRAISSLHLVGILFNCSSSLLSRIYIVVANAFWYRAKIAVVIECKT